MLRHLRGPSGWLLGRQWSPYRGCSNLSEASSTAESAEGAVCSQQRPPRLRQVALLVAYQGNNYYGMEILRSSGFPTVEGALFRALQLSGAVAPRRSVFPPHYSRASRTDRRVSALGQVVSLRMLVWDGVLEAINAHLPADIRVCGLRRVPPRFSAQTLCDDRLYSYTVPTFAFTPMEQPVTVDYRLPAGQLQLVRRLLQQYVGSHSFHSFSPGGDPSAAQMNRRIISVDVDEPYITHGLEFTNIWIRGCSFVLNQIRRMVGLAAAVFRGAAGPDALRQAMAHRRLTGTTAPGLGLILREARFETIAAAPWNTHGPLRWDVDSAEAVSQLERQLVEHIHRTEAEEMVTFRYVDGLLHNRIGAVITGNSSFRSPLGYALLMAKQEHDLRGGTEVATVTSGPPEIIEMTRKPTEVAGVVSGPKEVVGVIPDSVEMTQVTADPKGLADVVPDRKDIAGIVSDPSEITEVAPDPSEVLKIKRNRSEITEMTSARSAVTEVR